LTACLGINGIEGIFHDSSASIVRGKTVVASVEEERFNRKKHTSGIPYQSIDYCLKTAATTIEEVDSIGYYLNPLVL
jgi:carbamoyltransferase